MSPTDDGLMAAIVAGDREAFAALYRRRRPDVYRFALHMTGSPSVAEDVAQDVFLVVIRDAGRYVPRLSGVVPWLLGIARNHVRRRLAADRPSEPLDGERTSPVTNDVIETMQRDEEIAALRRALARLSASYREVVVLCDLQEMTYADASAAIGCAVGTVRSRLHRARALLARAMRSPRDRPAAERTNGRRDGRNMTTRDSGAWIQNGAIRPRTR